MSRSPAPRAPLPEEPIDRLIAPLERFLHVEAAGGVVLLACTFIALIIANSSLAEAYHHFWHLSVGVDVGSFELRYPLEHWVNDGLMTIFFFVVGLEVKRELAVGDLRDPRAAALPIAGALGGMLAPAAIYLSLSSPAAARGWGIAMATDIAFVVGCMAVLGARVPAGLRVMLLTLAIADDVGAILVIALGYSSGIAWTALALGMAGIGAVVLFGRVGVRSFAVYTLLGIITWVAFMKSGVHATVAGVALGLLTPAAPYLPQGGFTGFLEQVRSFVQGGGWSSRHESTAQVRVLQRATRETVSPLEYLENVLHPWVSFAIMPIFALANAAVPVHLSDLADPVALAVGAGLLLGKPIGIAAASWLAVRARLARLPQGVSWPQVAAGGVLCGIGFTMALFIANLALTEAALAAAKVGILAGSALAAVIGMALLALFAREPSSNLSRHGVER